MEGPASRQPRAVRPSSVDVRQEAPSAGPVGVVFRAEGFAEQPLLSFDARQHNDERQHGENNADTRTEGKRPAKREQKETKVAWMANEPVEPAGDQSMFGLDRNQAAEAPPQDKDRLRPKRKRSVP